MFRFTFQLIDTMQLRRLRDEKLRQLEEISTMHAEELRYGRGTVGFNYRGTRSDTVDDRVEVGAVGLGYGRMH